LKLQHYSNEQGKSLSRKVIKKGVKPRPPGSLFAIAHVWNSRNGHQTVQRRRRRRSRWRRRRRR
jgi:hypothetical protein